MRKCLWFVCAGLFVSGAYCAGTATIAGATSSSPGSERVMQQMSLQPLAFIKNDGQWHKDALYQAKGDNFLMWFTEEGVLYHLTRRIEAERDYSLIENRGELSLSQPKLGGVETRVVKSTLVGGNPQPRVVAENKLDYECNWFIGNDPDKWHTNVPTYSALTYKQVYPGIDVRYRGNGEEVEHDFIIAPGADPSQIELRYDGAQSIELDRNGDLVIVTDMGELRERIPKTYQERDGHLEMVNCCYEISGGSTVRFLLDEGHDASLPLVIDPVMLVYGSYLGGSANEWDQYGVMSIAVDGSGNAYVGGETTSLDFPTQDSLDGSHNGGIDIFVTKLAATGDALEFSTYLGGSGGGTIGEDYSGNIAVDNSGSVYLAGATGSGDFPTQNAYDGILSGQNDAFVTKLSPAGNALEYSTFLGGSGRDGANGIAVDASGSAYVAGTTGFSGGVFPTVNPYDDTLNGHYDFFVTKFTPQGDALVYSTLLGGNDADGNPRIAVDASGSAYVMGTTYSANYPTTANAFDITHNGGNQDIVVTKFTPEGNALEYSTYLGGSGSNGELGSGIAVDASENALVTGETWSPDFPTKNPYDGSFNGGFDIFVTKIAPSGDSLVYSTFLGGPGDDWECDMTLDPLGNAVVTGWAQQGGFPMQSAFDASYNGGNGDAFVTKLSATGDALYFSTYLGGNGEDAGHGVAVDSFGHVYVLGHTLSTNFPTLNAFDTSYNGGWDAFVVKLKFCPCDCHADPSNCDGVQTITDVVETVNVGFRAAAAILDPNPACLYETTDTDCNGVPDVIDIVKMVNVTFRAANPATEFCNTCP